MDTPRDRAIRYSEACGEYVAAAERDRLIADWEKKDGLANGVVQDFHKRVGVTEGKSVLEVGFGNGIQLGAFVRAGADMHGLEVNSLLKEIAEEYLRDENLGADLRLYNGESFPYPDESFDYAYSISVLEHVSKPEAVLREVARILKPGGAFYLAFPNRFAIRETHTGVWFLSYFPLKFAQFLLRCTGRNTIEELNLHFISYFAVLAMLKDTGLRIQFEQKQGTKARRFLKNMLHYLGLHHSILLPHIMVIVRKPI